MEWKQFLESTVENVMTLTTHVQEEINQVNQICTKYEDTLKTELATPEEYKNFTELKEQREETQRSLTNVQAKSSEQLVIQFVGATSSGKSSVINALLREDRLPVGYRQSTICSIKVCTTKDKEWSVDLLDENGNLMNAMSVSVQDEKKVKEILSRMSGGEGIQFRGDLNIGPRSIVRVNWPQELCKVLPTNVVLIDTPGIGEDDASDKFTTELGKQADIIVAVMDLRKPSKKGVST